MDTTEPYLFSTAGLSILDRLPFDPSARAIYEIMSGGLMWRDEVPGPDIPNGKTVWTNYSFRFLLASRASITLGEPQIAFRSVWEQVAIHAPNWPGLRPERRGAKALRRLKAALRGQKKCLAEMEEKLATAVVDF